jgi:hypothetical protein
LTHWLILAALSFIAANVWLVAVGAAQTLADEIRQGRTGTHARIDNPQEPPDA